MMDRRLLIILMLFWTICYDAIGQTLTRFYPLNDGSAKEKIHRKDGTVNGTVQLFPDRFGNQTGAIGFSSNAYISTPGFFTDATYVNGFSISFWIYVDEEYTKKTGTLPWEATDTLHRAFYALQDGQPLLGFCRRRDRAILDRYVINIKSGNPINFGIWYWDPLNFTSRKGWYHIFLSYKKNMMTTYMFYPTGQLEYALHYLQLQNLEAVTEWGLGSKIDNSVKYLDDFKVYTGPLSLEEVKKLHNLEAVPNGMYTVSSAFDLNTYWQTKDFKTSLGAQLYVQPLTKNNEPTMQWVFEPIQDKPGQCKIRMGYFGGYLATIGEKSGYVATDYPDYSVSDWIIEPSGDGYFFVRSANAPEMYMKSEAIAFSKFRSVQVVPFNSAEAPYYKWKFNQLYFRNELSSGLFNSNVYEIVDSYNTVFSLYPELPFTASSVEMSVNRGVYPTLLTQYEFKKDKDNSYVIYNRAFSTKALQPKDYVLKDKQPIILNDWHSDKSDYYRFIVDRPNPLGKQIRLRPIMAQSLMIYSGDYPTVNQVSLRTEKAYNSEGYQWQAFNSKSFTNVNKQVSTITPGIYKISSLLDERKYWAPKAYSFDKETSIVLSTYKDVRSTAYYWIVDYERDNYGKPIKDGAYTIQLYGGDNRYAGSTNLTIPEGERLKSIGMDKEHFSFAKWFITPARDGTNSFYLQSASDKLKYIHTVNSTASEMNEIEYSYLRSTDISNSFKWKLEKVILPKPLESGVYRISLQGYYIHTNGDEIKESVGVELGEITSTGTYEWLVEQNADKSYSLSVANHSPKLYLHTNHSSLSISASLDASSYDSEHSESFKWLLFPTGEKDVYYVRLVGNMEDGYMHLFNNALTYGTPLEIYKYIDSVDITYRWRFERIR